MVRKVVNRKKNGLTKESYYLQTHNPRELEDLMLNFYEAVEDASYGGAWGIVRGKSDIDDVLNGTVVTELDVNSDELGEFTVTFFIEVVNGDIFDFGIIDVEADNRLSDHMDDIELIKELIKDGRYDYVGDTRDISYSIFEDNMDGLVSSGVLIYTTEDFFNDTESEIPDWFQGDGYYFDEYAL